MQTPLRFLLALLLLLPAALPSRAQTAAPPAPVVPAPAPAPVPHYIAPASVDLKALLSDPSSPGSAETQKEIAILLEKQAARTPEALARAQAEVKLTPYAFADVLGSWFKAGAAPLADALLKDAAEDSKGVSEAAKKLWNRPRPPLQDPRIVPAVELEKNGSYPSGHSTRGTLYAAILAQLAPDLKEKLAERGRQIGDDRVLAGVHFPSDVEAGRTLGAAIAAKLLADPAFQAALAKAKPEFDAARKAAK